MLTWPLASRAKATTDRRKQKARECYFGVIFLILRLPFYREPKKVSSVEKVSWNIAFSIFFATPTTVRCRASTWKTLSARLVARNWRNNVSTMAKILTFRSKDNICYSFEDLLRSWGRSFLLIIMCVKTATKPLKRTRHLERGIRIRWNWRNCSY